ncbi:hypothetical protein K8I85_13700 [bacterium]|nr:hypothetical protein [bacterium]
MPLSFHEKSLWLMLLSLLGVFGFYFGAVVAPGSTNVEAEHVAAFVSGLVILVLIQIAGHVVIAVVDRHHDTDERDRAIALKGTRNAAYVLSTGVFLTLCTALLTDGNFVFTHVLLASWVLAQLVEIGSQLVLHRRGV